MQVAKIESFLVLLQGSVMEDWLKSYLIRIWIIFMFFYCFNEFKK